MVLFTVLHPLALISALIYDLFVHRRAQGRIALPADDAESAPHRPRHEREHERGVPSPSPTRTAPQAHGLGSGHGHGQRQEQPGPGPREVDVAGAWGA